MTHKLLIANIDDITGEVDTASRVELIVWQEERAKNGESVIRTAIRSGVIHSGTHTMITIGDGRGVTVHEIPPHHGKAEG